MKKFFVKMDQRLDRVVRRLYISHPRVARMLDGFFYMSTTTAVLIVLLAASLGYNYYQSNRYEFMVNDRDSAYEAADAWYKKYQEADEYRRWEAKHHAYSSSKSQEFEELADHYKKLNEALLEKLDQVQDTDPDRGVFEKATLD